MLRFKGSELYCDVIKNYGRDQRNWLDRLCEETFTEDICKDLPAELEKQGIETTAEQCRNQSAVIVGHYADELEQKCLKSAQEASDGKTPEIIIRDLEEFHLGLIRKMDAELENEFGRYSDRYMDALNEFRAECKSLSSTDPIREFSDYDRRSKELNSLLENKSLSAWRDVFEDSDWSDAAILHRIDDVLSESIYDMLRQANGDLDETIQIALQSVYKNFFRGTLAYELREAVVDRLVMNDDAKTLLRIVDDVVDNTARRLEGEIIQRVEDLVGPMIDEYHAELM